MQQQNLIQAVVRVWRVRTGGTPEAVVGTGFLVSPRHVLTCAHVVAEALSLEHEVRKVPSGAVLLDLPASAPGRFIKGRVVVWHARVPSPGGVYDIAGLELDDALPHEAMAVPLLTSENLWDRSCRTFGFPAGRPDGSYAEGTLKDVLTNSWVMIRGGADAREFARPGYSGGPVYTEQGVVGMLTEGDHQGRVREAVMIPTQVLLKAWPELYHLNTTCPYRGLASFGPDDARFFRGRDEVSGRLAEVVAGPPYFTILAGASGSGKSSIISAGVVPRLQAVQARRQPTVGVSPHAEVDWQVVSLNPGTAPFRALAHALLTLWQPELRGTQRLQELARFNTRLHEGGLYLAEVLESILQQRPPRTKLLLVVDQSEELFTQGQTDGDVKSVDARNMGSLRFLEELLEGIVQPEIVGRISLLLGIRTDFLDQLLEHPAVAKLQSRHDVVYHLGAVADLRAVIEEPLKAVGLGTLEPGLTERIIADVEGEPNPLPLLEFTLTELWQRQRGGTLSHAAYDELGGVPRALANYAQTTYDALSPAEQAQAREVFLQLMQPVEGLAATRRVASLVELGEEKHSLIMTLADKRLVVTGLNPDHPDTVEVVHEALFEHWPLLQSWVREGWAFRRWQEGLRSDVRDWLEHAQHPDYLLQGAKLAVAQSYLQEYEDKLAERERAYIRAGLEQQAAQAREETDRLLREALAQKRTNRILSAFLVVAIILSTAAAWQWNRAEQQATVVRDLNTDLVAASRRSDENARRALANKLSAQGLLATQNPGPTNGNPRLGALLAAQAVAVEDNVQSRGNLLRVVQSEPVPFSATSPVIKLSGDGKLMVTVSRSSPGTFVDLLVWELPGGRLRHTITTKVFSSGLFLPSGLAFSADGSRLAVGGGDGSIWLFDTVTGEAAGTLVGGHDYQAVGLTFTADGATLISSGIDGTLIIWDVAVGQVTGRIARQEAAEAAVTVREVAPLPFRRRTSLSPEVEHFDWLNSVAVSPDGRVLAFADLDGAVRLLDLRTRELFGVVSNADAARSLAFSADGQRLAVGDRQGTVQVWEVASQRPLGGPYLGLNDAARAVTLSPDGALLATAGADGTVLLQGQTDREIQTALTLGAEIVDALFFLGDSLYIAGREGERAAIWQVSLVFGTPEIKQSLRATYQLEGGVDLWDVRAGGSLSSPLLGVLDGFAVRIVHSPDGERVVTRTNERRAQLWDVETREPLGPPLEGQEYIEGIAFSPDGRILATGSADGQILLRDGETGAALGSPLPLGIPRAVSLAFSPDGQHLAVGTEGWVVVWDLQKRAVVGEPEWDTPATSRMDLVEAVTYSPDGSMLIGSYDSLIYLWDSETLQMLGPPLPGMADDRKVRDLFVSPDSRVLVGAYNDGWTNALWNLQTLEPIRVLSGVSGSAFSPDSKLFVTGGIRAITFWDAAALEPLGDPVPAHDSFVRVMSFSPDGRTLVSGAEDNSVLFWQVDLASWLRSACERAERNLTGAEWSRYLVDFPYEKTCREHPVDASAVELLFDQAARAAANGDEPTAGVLHERALTYAAEADLPEVIRRACEESAGQTFLASVSEHCGTAMVTQEVSDVSD